MERLSRRSFMKIAGAATGAAALAAAPPIARSAVGDEVLYPIYIDNDGDALPDVTYQFQFNTTLRNEETFLYNTGPIGSLDSPSWNKRQFYDVSVIREHGHNGAKKQHHEQDGKGKVLARDLACPPSKIG